MSNLFKTTINGTQVSLSDIFTAGSYNYTDSFKDSNGSKINFGAQAGTTETFGIDTQNANATNFIASDGKDISNKFAAKYIDYGLDRLTYHGSSTTWTETVPGWCDYIIAIAVSGGGWVSYGRNTNDQNWTSGSGGSGAYVCWKSSTNLGGRNWKYSVQIHQGKRISSGGADGDGGDAWIKILDNNDTLQDYVVARGGGQSGWVNGDDDDDTHWNNTAGSSGAGGKAGTYNHSGGTILYYNKGSQGQQGVWDRYVGTTEVTNPNNTNIVKGDIGWSLAGRGAYWDTGNGIDLNTERIDGGENGAVRIYFIAYDADD